jgi:hypothetical protein
MNTPTLMQSEEKIAPWNRKYKTIPINISQCLSTTVDIEVPEDFEDYDNKELLEDFVREQIVLPSELTLIHSPNCWYVDELCINI